MSVNRMRVKGTPAEVFAILADPYTYEHWVVGCVDIRAVEGEWPAVGSLFHHTVGMGPFKVKDNTKVLDVDADTRLVIEARARPAGVAEVVFTLTPVPGGTEVCIQEYAVRGFAQRIANPVLDFLVHLRNAETLRRLDKQVEQGAGRARTGPPPSGSPERPPA